MMSIASFMEIMERKETFSDDEKNLILMNAKNVGQFAEKLNAYTIEQRQQYN